MKISPLTPRVHGLNELSTESRIISTPWSRMVRGIGLGQYPIDYDPAIAGHLRDTFDQLIGKVPPSDFYTLFCRALTDFVLRVTDPAMVFGPAQIEQAVGPLVEAARAEKNPYYRLLAGCLVIDAWAKLDLDASLLVNAELDFPAEILDLAAGIAPDQINDDNRGRHGDYERISAYTAVFLALGQIGLKDRLVTDERNYIVEALDLLQNVPAPFYRGRGGSMLLSVVALLGYDKYIFDGDRDYMKETLDYLARADELQIFPSLPQEIAVAWAKVYPLLTMLNAIATGGRAEYLHDPIDWLAEAKSLLADIPSAERSHMSQYYIVALHNLGRLRDELPDLDAYVAEVVAELDVVDPGADFFTSGIAYPYIIEAAMLAGRLDLIPQEALDRMVDSFADLERTAVDRANRAFPVSYALNILGEIGAADMVFTPRSRYGGISAMNWVIDRISDGAQEEGTKLYLLNHALVSYALRLRGTGARETELFRDFDFRLAPQ
ncbi:hypothetical protein [Actinoplanes subtropicus]|uniref:hypothetical protein n=1 Tax=Actinoplanes subtropicus TaxID=543632 RepID=UPI0004C32983|nr:hypothetical protein [Actinoplanes subtropicus]